MRLSVPYGQLGGGAGTATELTEEEARGVQGQTTLSTSL